MSVWHICVFDIEKSQSKIKIWSLFAQAGEETRNTEKENLPANPKKPERIPDRRPQRSDTAGKWLLFDLVDTLLDEAAAPDPYEEYEMIRRKKKRYPHR